jgi:hypothetical protein
MCTDARLYASIRNLFCFQRAMGNKTTVLEMLNTQDFSSVMLLTQDNDLPSAIFTININLFVHTYKRSMSGHGR